MSGPVTQNGYLMAVTLVNYKSLSLSSPPPPRLPTEDKMQLPGPPEISQQSTYGEIKYHVMLENQPVFSSHGLC